MGKGIICKDDNLFFDMLKQGMENKDKIKIAKCTKALHAFFMEPKRLLQKKIQAIGVSTSADFPLITKDSFNVTVQSQNFDMGYEKVFKLIPLGQNQDAWEIYDVANSLTFVRVEEGQRIDVAGYTGRIRNKEQKILESYTK